LCIDRSVFPDWHKNVLLIVRLIAQHYGPNSPTKFGTTVKLNTILLDDVMAMRIVVVASANRIAV